MKHQHFSKSVILCWLVLLMPVISHASVTHVSLKSAMLSHTISVHASSAGGYCGKCLKLDIQNNTSQDLFVDIDPGLIFTPRDSNCQYLVLLGNETFEIGPMMHTQETMQTFCGKSYASCPYAGITYDFWRQGDSAMIKTLGYVKERNIDMHLAQKAVWTFTNNHPLSCIYSAYNFRESEDLVSYIAALRKMPVPQYHIQYRMDERPNQPTIVYGESKMYVDMHWDDNQGYRHMYVTVYKANGEIYKEITAGHTIDRYGTFVQVEFDPRHDIKGTYYVRLHDDENRVWDEKAVLVEEFNE